jgi:hypothetical protein
MDQMEDSHCGLGSTPMRTLRINTIQEDFVFVFGNKRYNCLQIIAEFLSPRICLQLSVDASITEYIVGANDVNGSFDLFGSLWKAATIQVTEANCASLLSLSRKFGNSDILSSILKHCHSQYPLARMYDHFDEVSIPFLASEFYRLTSPELDKIPVPALYDILSHDRLKISSEDSLYWYLSSHFSSNPEYCDLLQFVQFEYVSPDCISDFLLIMADSVDHRLWEAISRRLISGVPFPLSGVSQRTFALDPSRPLDGIIASLTSEANGNVDSTGVVAIIASGCLDEIRFPPRNIANVTENSNFVSKNESNPWISYDFKYRSGH